MHPEPQDAGLARQTAEGPGTPPVTNTAMPACAASSMVADTVVAPSARAAITAGRSRRDVLRTRLPLRSRHMYTCINVLLPGCNGSQLEDGDQVGIALGAVR